MTSTSQPTPTPAELLSAVRETLSEQNLQFNLDEGQRSLTVPFRGEIVDYDVFVYVGPGYVTMLGQLAIRIPDDRVDAILLALNEQTINVPLGNFQINIHQRHVQFKMGILVGVEPPSSQVLADAVFTTAAAISGVASTVIKALSQSKPSA